MNGQLSEQPLAELIRAFSAKSLAGRLQLQHDRVKVVVYFDKGEVLYAASNLRTLRLREYLLKTGMAEAALTRYDAQQPDLQLVKKLRADYLLSAASAEQVQTQQVSDVLRLALMWTEGTWAFDPRSHLDEAPKLTIDTDSLILEAARRMPAPAPVDEAADEAQAVESFLAQNTNANTYYDVLGVDNESPPDQVKTRYYELARRYHPDRFRKAESTLVTRIESAFARVTQAYETLRDDRLRAGYDAKLLARQKAQRLAETAPKPSTPAPSAESTNAQTLAEAGVSVAERAEIQFKEGFAALELGQRKVAIGLFAAAANAVPKEPRYRAFYGKLLAEQQNTRRAAEAELQAAVKLDPQNGEYRVMLAELYRDLGLMLRARGEAERAVAADPNNRKARDLLRTLKSV